MSDAPSQGPTVVAITGACTSIGTEAIRRLSDQPTITRILALDVKEPDVLSDKVQFIPLDLSRPSVGPKLVDILAKHRPDTFIHGGFLSAPSHRSAWAHELEDVGTMHVLDACARQPPGRFVLLSTTFVYGACPDRPTYLREEDALGCMTKSRFVNDRIRSEKQVMRFSQNYPNIAVCSLRFAKLLGPNSDNVITRFLSRPVVPTIAGFDPLMQCVHEEDALRAILLAVGQSARGAFNIVGKDVLPYTTLLALLGRLPAPMPKRMAKFLGSAMWATGLSEVPSTMIDHLQYSCVADESKARNELNFVAQYDIRQTLSEFLGMPLNDSPNRESMGARSAGRVAFAPTWMN